MLDIYTLSETIKIYVISTNSIAVVVSDAETQGRIMKNMQACGLVSIGCHQYGAAGDPSLKITAQGAADDILTFLYNMADASALQQFYTLKISKEGLNL